MGGLINVAGREYLGFRSAARAWFDVLGAVAEVGLLLPGTTNRLAWQEFQNKLRAFDLFEHADLMVGPLPGEGFAIQKAVTQLALRERWDSVWVAEGISWHYATSKRINVPSLLPEGAAWAAKYLVPFHTGMGMSLAEAALRNSSLAARTIVDNLNQFFEVCRSHSRKGCQGAAYETLGLVARTLSPHLIRPIDQVLSQAGSVKLAYFWHGVGRAMYFLPTAFFPADWLALQAMQKAGREAPHTLGRLNATAGVTWAFTLVNIRHPQVLEAFFKRLGDTLPSADAIANGVGSVLMFWRQCAGEDVYWRALAKHSEVLAGTQGSRLWERYVVQPCRFASRFSEIVAERHQISDMFRYRPLDEWTHELRTCAPSMSGSGCVSAVRGGLKRKCL
jgi:hypothetical protein